MKLNNIFNTFNPKMPEIKQSRPNFGSAALTKRLLSGGALRKFADAIEYDGFSMTVPSILGLFVIMVGDRFVEAYDKHDRREIVRRDVSCLTVLMFMARALAKGFSEIFQNTTGFVLNHKPEKFDKFGTKLWAYVNPLSEFAPLNGEQIISKYSKIDDFKNGIVDFCEFINKGGGNVKKVLSFNKDVKENVEKILSNIGKSFDNAGYADIIKGFKEAEKSTELEKIYKIFSEVNNPFVKKAKTRNSIFGFLSTFILTPAFIIWIAKSNEKMTKKRIAKELAEKEARKTDVSKPAELDKAA